MKKIYITVPYAVDLTKEKIWTEHGPKKDMFFVARFHYMIEDRQGEGYKRGEAIQVIGGVPGTTTEVVKAISFEGERVDVVATLKKYLLESKFSNDLFQKIQASVGVNSTKAGSTTSSKLRTEIKSMFSSEEKVKESHKIKRTVSYEIKHTIGPEVGEPVAVVPLYQQRVYNVYLAYIDYLWVEYKTSFLGLRKKRKKYPIADSVRHNNILKINLPLTRAHFWRFMENSSELIKVKDHKPEIDDPDEIILEPGHQLRERAVRFPESVPTLYQIAEATFPRKWSKRRGDWTEEELKTIEIEEFKVRARSLFRF